MITYTPFRAALKKKGVTQYKLIKTYHVSSGQLGRMKKNMYVSTHTIELYCGILNCRVEEIMEYIPDEALQQEIDQVRE